MGQVAHPADGGGGALQACGHYDAAGDWVQMYNGTNDTISPDGRAQYEQDVQAWTAAITAKSHAAGMLMIPNYQPSLHCTNANGMQSQTVGALCSEWTGQH